MRGINEQKDIEGNDGSAAQSSEVSSTEKLPHSRACGWQKHDHGTACHSNCPTCGGKDPRGNNESLEVRSNSGTDAIHTNSQNSMNIPSNPDIEGKTMREMLAYQIHDTDYSSLKAQDKLSVDQAVTAIQAHVEAEKRKAEQIFKNYWYHAGRWHKAGCWFLILDEGVCNCPGSHTILKQIRTELEEQS